MLDAAERAMRSRLGRLAAQPPRERGEQDVTDQRALSGARDPGHADEAAQWKARVDAAQVVLPRALPPPRGGFRPPPAARHAAPRRGRGPPASPPPAWCRGRAPPPPRCCRDRAV